MAYQPNQGITSLVSTVPSSVLVGASVFGNVGISGTPNVNTAGSVVAFQGTDPWIQTGSVQGTVSVLGTVPVTQSGTVVSSLVSTVPSSVIVGASVFGIPNPLVITGSVQGAGAGTQYSEDAATPADPTGTAQVLRRTDTPSVSGSADGDWVVRNATNYGAAYTQIVDSSGNYVDNFGGGTSSVVQQGTWRASVVNSIPSSLLVGASVFGNVGISGTPNVNAAGSVVAFQGTASNLKTESSIIGTIPTTQVTSPWIITGSVQGAGAGTQYSEDAAAPADPTGTAQVLRRTDTPSVSGSADGDWVVRNATNYGAAYTQIVDSSGNYVDTFGGGSSSVVQQGTWRTSVISSTPSSMLVGASVIGNVPTKPDNLISTNNSSTDTLAGDATFTGTGDDISGYAAITIQLDSSHDSATDGMTFQFSTDDTNWDDTYSFTYTAADGARRFQFPVTAQYFRVRYTNGSTLQTHFRLQTILHRNSPAYTSIHRVVDNVHPDRSSELTKSAIIAQAAGSGDFVPIQATAGGNFKISLEEVDGAVVIPVNAAGSVVAFMGGDWTTSIVGNVGQTGAYRTSVISSTPSSMLVGASIFGLAPVNVTNATLAVTQSGAWNTGQTGTRITSVVSTVPSSVIVGASIFGLAPVNVTNATLAVTQSGAWNTGQTGAVRASVVSSTPSSMLVGASVFGNVGISGTPNVNTAGSVVAFQGTDPWIVDGSGSTQPISGNVGQTGTIRTSVVSSTPSSMLVGASVYGIPNPLVITGSVQGAGAGTQYSEDAAAPADPTGTAQVLRRTDTPSVSGSADGDWVVRNATNYGAAYTQIVDSSGNYVDTFGGGTQYTEDAAAAADPVGNAQIVVATSTPSIQGEDGDNIARRGTRYGGALTTLVDSSGEYQNLGSVAAFVQGTPNVNAAGSVVAFQGTSPWVIAGNNSSIIAAGSYQEETVGGPSVRGMALVWQSNANTSVMSTVSPLNPLRTLGSVQGSFSVVGTVPVTQSGTWNNTQAGTVYSSIVNIVPSSVIVGASIFGLPPVNVTNTNLNVSGSVAAFQTGTYRTSVVSSTPSSMLVGASVFGNVGISGVPNVNTAGSVVAFQGSSPWATLPSESANHLQGTADLRGNSGGSVVVIAAQGASVFTRITGVQIANIGGASVLVTLDGATSSTIGYTIAPDGGGSNIVYPIPLKTNANGAFTASISGQSSVLIAAQGYTENE